MFLNGPHSTHRYYGNLLEFNRNQIFNPTHRIYPYYVSGYALYRAERLFEEKLFGSDGRLLNPNLADYKIPTSRDMPELESIIVESNEPNGPFGAKEVGEGTIMPTIPSILNAIYDATGVHVTELPVTPERIIQGMRDLGKKA